MPFPVNFPLLNANEPEALLAAVHVTEGQRMAEGDLLFALETTKSTAEVAAEVSGFVAGVQASQGQIVRAGDLFCYLADDPAWRPPVLVSPLPSEAVEGEPPAGLRITQPARLLAQQVGLDLAKLPIGPVVTERMVRELAGLDRLPVSEVDQTPEGAPPAVLVYGGGGHGKAVIDLLLSLGTYRLVGVIDDGLPRASQVIGFSVLGGQAMLAELRGQGVHLAVNAVGGIGNVAVRLKVFKILEQAGFRFPTLVHPSAWVEPSASLAAGVQVFPHAYVGSETRVGFGSIVNTGAILSHECILGECVNISPGAILAGQVQVGDRALIGMGVTVNLQVQVGAGARVGNGATVKADVPPNGIVRAGAVYP